MSATIDNGQMDLFDLLPAEDRTELGLDQPKTPPAPVTRETKTRPSKPAPAKAALATEPDEYDIDRTVYYAGHRLAVPSRTMKKEDVRAWLEEQFPELRQENTEMVYDEKTGVLIPVLKAHTKGSAFETVFLERPDPVPPVWKQQIAGEVWECRRTQAGEFALPVVHEGPGFVRVGRFIPAVPRPPADLLDEILHEFRMDPEQEHLANIVWHEHRHFVHWPSQHVTRTSVIAQGVRETETWFVYLQIHSHGRMEPFFSATDDRDEVRTGLYAVTGCCHYPRPKVRFRMSVGGRFTPLDAADVLAGTEGRVWA